MRAHTYSRDTTQGKRGASDNEGLNGAAAWLRAEVGVFPIDEMVGSSVLLQLWGSENIRRILSQS